MRLHRFYVEQKIKEGENLNIDYLDFLHQVQKVFRLKGGDKLIVFDGSGFEYEAEIETISKEKSLLKIGRAEKIGRPKFSVHLLQSIIKKDNFEFVVQKCTEIGVKGFRPIISERSEKKDLNLERLKKIAIEASEQSGRGELPEIFAPEKLSEAILTFNGQLFVLDFDGAPISATKISGPENIGILIGPEGGWSDSERKLFEEKGIPKISLGKQTLRAETASVAIASLILLQ